MPKMYYPGFVMLAFLAACAPQRPNSMTESHASIVGGQIVKADSAIAQSVVEIDGTSQGQQFICTGVLVSSDTVLTAGHCGADLSAGELIFKKEHRTIEQVVVNPRFDATMKRMQESDQSPTQIKNWGDLALLKFSGGVPKDFVPADVSDGNELSDGDNVVLAGYGLTDPQAEKPSRKLRMIARSILDANFSTTEFSVDQADGNGACHGDSGGPAFVESGGKLKLVGITSRGVNDDCSELSIYTRVASYADWIQKSESK